MTRGRTVATMAGVFALLAAAILTATPVRADRDEEGERSGGYEYEGEHERGAQPAPLVPLGAAPATPQVPRAAAPAAAPAAGAPVSAGEARYREECGSCHMAYPPGLLPAASWRALMAELDRHFGQNAELDPQSAAALTAWLTANAAEAGTHPLSRKVLRSVGGATPLRISEVPFIAREHREVRPSVWSRPAVGSVANCGACHTGAEQGNFDEDRISIPK